ncbi:MAG: hypothetical protein IRZ16_00020 [Myxococcaceae bacterium]|nr:hypothetical protein [Myxococcaceae bacterium]
MAAVLVALCGCKAGPPTIGDPPPTLADAEAERAYQALLQKYTGTGEVYQELDTHLFAGATFQAWPFREARVQRMAKFQVMTSEEVQARLGREREEWEKFHVFELGTWTQNPKFDDFDSPKSIWRIALVTGRGELLPVSVERVERVDQNVRALYPYMGMFWVHYRVKFPRTFPDGSPAIPPGTDHVTLRIASTLGRTDLRTGAE